MQTDKVSFILIFLEMLIRKFPLKYAYISWFFGFIQIYNFLSTLKSRLKPGKLICKKYPKYELEK